LKENYLYQNSVTNLEIYNLVLDYNSLGGINSTIFYVAFLKVHDNK